MMLPQAYTNLSIFKRIEVWILLVLTAAGLAFVLLSGALNTDPDAPDDSDTPGESSTEKKTLSPTAPAEFQSDGPLVIAGVSVKRDGKQSFLSEISFSFDNQSAEALRPIEQAKLITASGKSVPVFVLAFSPIPPTLPAKQKTSSSMLFSLEAEDIVGKLTLDLAGTRTAVKSERSFDPESIQERQTKTFENLDW